MNKLLTLLICILVCESPMAIAQRNCGAELLKNTIIANHPRAHEQLEQQRLSLQSIADQYKLRHNDAAEKNTASSPVPVIFHVIVDSAQFMQLGGTNGISHRCDSQMAVLNRDFNRQNGDSSLIPASFKPMYSSVGIGFGLAHTGPDGYATPGYEIKVIPVGGFNGATSSYSEAKHAVSNGLDAWDVSRYLNIWCINFLDYPGLIGITVAPSFVDSGWSPANEMGICLTYNVFGSRESVSDNYPNHFDEGRSLTHEIGHFFEIWHPWGDDGGLCPTTGGKDDGIADTPPEANNASGSPTGPIFDACTTAGDGVMWMNYMDYCNDNAVHMFTIDQAAVMAAQVADGGPTHSLTQNPSLLNWGPVAVYITTVHTEVSMFPNPATQLINISCAPGDDPLLQVTITNLLGQTTVVENVSTMQKNFYSIDLSGMDKGIYFVRCNFATGSVTRKIELQ